MKNKKRIDILREREKEKCFYCLKKVKKGQETRDHLTPRSKGGKSTLENLVYCCRSCNSSKGKRDRESYIAYLLLNNAVKSLGAHISLSDNGITISFGTKEKKKIVEIFNKVKNIL